MHSLFPIGVMGLSAMRYCRRILLFTEQPSVDVVHLVTVPLRLLHNLQWNHRQCCLALVFVCLTLAKTHCVHVAEQAVGLFRLQRAYVDMEGSNKRNGGRGISQQHFELLKAHDRARRLRILSSVVDFPIGGTADPYIAGLYFTRIWLGTPLREYFVQVDTGSDVLWLNCSPCISCPTASNLGIPMIVYDPHLSSTSSPVSCTDQVCKIAQSIADTGCNNDKNCGYSFQYGDGSTTIGYLVADNLLYSAAASGSTFANAEMKIIFGCAYNQTGGLLTSERAVDGIMGFGQHGLSLISQLYSQGKTPRIFAHCLRGDDSGGGVLVLGNVLEPGFVYTPIVPSQPHYNVELKNIAVNGVALNVDPSFYRTSNVQGTIFDSGTTLTYLTEPAFGPFINAIIEGAPAQAHTFSSEGNVCFLYAGSVDDAFPTVTLHFEGADMNLKATNYLIQQPSFDNVPVWCIVWQPSLASNGVRMTILGDLVLKDKVVVYDLENQRIGWVHYDCSSSLTVSTAAGIVQSISAHQLGNIASTRKTKQILLTFFILIVTNCCLTMLN
eukprot:c25851_g1_i3 orf=664-2322(+)